MSNDTRGVYTRLYTTTIINLLSDAIAGIALPLAFLAKTGSVTLAATLSAATQFPQLLLTLPLSALSDRLPRKPIIILGYAIEGICLAILVYLLSVGNPSALAVIIVGIVRGSISELGASASAGYVPQVLGRKNLLHYHSRVETVEGVAAIVGPPTGGALVNLLGGAVSLIVPAILSFFNGIVYLFLPNAESQKTKNSSAKVLSSIIPDIMSGIKYLASNKLLVSVLLINFSLGVGTTSYIFGVSEHLKINLNLQATTIGLLMALSGVGGIIASFTLEKIFKTKDAVKVLIISSVLSAVCLGTFAFNQSILLAGLLLLLLDFAWVGGFIYSTTLQENVTEDNYLARISSLNGLAFVLGSGMSSAFAALSIDRFGIGFFMIVIALFALAPILLLMRCVKHPIQQ